MRLESLVEEQALPERVSQVGGNARQRKESNKGRKKRVRKSMRKIKASAWLQLGGVGGGTRARSRLRWRGPFLNLVLPVVLPFWCLQPSLGHSNVAHAWGPWGRGPQKN